MSSLDKATILPIDPMDICFYNETAIPFIQSALERADQQISLEDVLTDIANHKRQLWVIKSHEKYIAAVVTQMYKTHNGNKVGEITLAGGHDHARWDHFVYIISNWFRAEGCNFIDIIGRYGWIREYGKRGFRPESVHLRKGL